MAKLWRYRAGRPGENLVIVFERYEGGPLQVETYPRGKRHRQTLKGITGKPVRDKKQAMKIAEIMAAKIDRQNRMTLEEALGIPQRRTLKDLLDAYHGKRSKKWSTSNAYHQESMKRFWLQRLGEKSDIRELARAAIEIEEIAANEADARDWSPRTEGKYLKYLVTAFNFGQRKLKWYTEAHNLSAVDIPSPDSEGKSYDHAEVLALLPALEQVDLRAGVAGHIAYVGLRRISAIRNLHASAVTFEAMRVEDRIERVALIEFPRTTDKSKKKGVAVIAGRGVELLEKLLATPAVKHSGLLFPGGSLKSTKADKPVPYEILHEWIWAAEKIAGVEHVDGRAWHAFKRRATTDAEEVMGSLAAASKQAGTLESTLRTIYLQADVKPKALLAVRLAAHIRNA